MAFRRIVVGSCLTNFRRQRAYAQTKRTGAKVHGVTKHLSPEEGGETSPPRSSSMSIFVYIREEHDA